MEAFDAIIVGAGPAGLTAATYLGRFRRRVLVLDGGPPRASWIPTSHNTPGFPGGVSGPELLARMRAQAKQYGAEIRTAFAGGMVREGQGGGRGFKLDLGDGWVSAPFVLMATGVLDRKPDLAGLDEAIHASVVRICPICDAYEAIDRRIAVLGDGDLGGREALFLRTYSDRVSLLLADVDALSQPDRLREAGVEIIETSTSALTLAAASVRLATARGGRDFDYLYLALGCEMESRLAVAWGAAHDETNNLIVDVHQQTSIDGLYAAGDVVKGLNQVAVATAEAAIAATDIHNRLPKRWIR